MIKNETMFDLPTDSDLLEILSQQEETDEVRPDLSGDEWADYILSTMG